MRKFLAFIFSKYLDYPGRSALILVLMTISLAFHMLFSLAFKYLIDDILGPGKFNMISGFLIFIIVGAIISSISDLFNDYLMVNLGTKVENKFRLSIFTHLQLLPESFYQRTNSGVLLNRTSVDLNNVYTGFLNLQPIIYSLLGIMISIGFLFSLDWRLTILAIIGISFSFIIPRLMNNLVFSTNDAYKSKNSRFGKLFYERLTAHGFFRAFGLRNWEYSRMEEMVNDITPIAIKSRFLSTQMHKSVVITLLLVNVVIVSVGTFVVLDKIITIGEFVAFQSFFISISGYITSLTKYFPQLIQSSLSLKRLHTILNEKPVSEPTSLDFAPNFFKNEIKFQEVSFEYIPGLSTLTDISMSLPLFSKCAIVGSSGSGKTSIISLLLRLYEPTKGSVMIDDIDIRGISSSTLRDMIGYVPQDIILLNLSIRENIRLGNIKATDMEIEEAAKAAGIHDWILSLSEGYDFMVVDRGENLSGGQKQRIAIARAIVRQPTIIILDEATSALDPSTEDLINQNMNHLVGSSTIISVTHRLHSIIDAERIFVIVNGKIASYGTHSQLLKTNEEYQKMWMKQNGFNISGNGRSAEITIDRLKQIPLFNELESELLEEIKAYMVTENYDSGYNVVTQGDEGDKFYIVVRGRVEVLLQQGPNQTKRLAVLEDGDYFGEMALLKEIPRTATIRTLDLCTLLSMDRDHFQKVIEKSTNVRKQLENAFDERIATHN